MTRTAALSAVLLAGCASVSTLPDAGSDVGSDAGPPEAHGLDLLFMIDNSGAMAEEQANLIFELPRLFRMLTSGDRDDDGVPDMAPVRSLHVGIVTSDMGAGGYEGVPTCAPGTGDDGILRARSRIRSEPCMASYPSRVFEFAGDESVDELTASVGCVANIGTGGCGFEQQLESPLKALTPVTPTAWTAPDYVPPRFASPDGVPDVVAGNAEGPNAGFLRPDSALAIMLVTDEEDCSIRDYGLYVTADPRFMSVPLNLRCHTFGDPARGIVQPTSRYIDGFIGLRRDPRLLAFSVLSGIPPETEATATAHDYEGVLAHPGMQARQNAMGTNLEPSCMTENGVAFAPIRMVEVAAGLHQRGARVSMSSICARSFEPAMDRFVASLAPVFPLP